MTTRRTFIAGSAATAASLAFSPNTPLTPGRSDWDAAMHQMQDADAAYDAHYRNVVLPIEDSLETRLRSNGIVKGSHHYDEKRRAVFADARDWHAAHEELDRLCDVFVDKQDVLMKMPAPDHEALRWKLDKILENSHGSTTAWSWEYAVQTVEDYRRLLS